VPKQNDGPESCHRTTTRCQFWDSSTNWKRNERNHTTHRGRRHLLIHVAGLTLRFEFQSRGTRALEEHLRSSGRVIHPCHPPSNPTDHPTHPRFGVPSAHQTHSNHPVCLRPVPSCVLSPPIDQCTPTCRAVQSHPRTNVAVGLLRNLALAMDGTSSTNPHELVSTLCGSRCKGRHPR
jgi:hypothetical protein